jgi:hypothetical protein
MSRSSAYRPAGTVELADGIEAAVERVVELRRDLGALRTRAGDIRYGGLVELDIGRALVGLAAISGHLERAHRHTRLIP